MTRIIPRFSSIILPKNPSLEMREGILNFAFCSYMRSPRHILIFTGILVFVAFFSRISRTALYDGFFSKIEELNTRNSQDVGSFTSFTFQKKVQDFSPSAEIGSGFVFQADLCVYNQPFKQFCSGCISFLQIQRAEWIHLLHAAKIPPFALAP